MPSGHHPFLSNAAALTLTSRDYSSAQGTESLGPQAATTTET